jgi:hypothetical protein
VDTLEPGAEHWSDEDWTAINRALTPITETYEAQSLLRGAFGQDLPQLPAAIAEAMDYHEAFGAESGDVPFGPMIELTDGRRYPPPLSEIPAEKLGIWAAAAEELAGSPVVSARLNDLLWSRKWQPRPHERARSAVRSYLATWSLPGPSVVTRADNLVRALQISLELNEDVLREEVAGVIVEAYGEVLSSDEWAPGPALQLASALGSLKPSSRPDSYGDLLVAALSRYRSDPFIVESVVELQLASAGPNRDRRRGIALEAVRAWEERAHASDGLLRTAYLERALAIAANEGLSEEAQRFRAELQVPRSPEELGMKRVAAEVSLPVEVFEAQLDAMVAGASPAERLVALAAQCPLIEDTEPATSFVREQMRSHPLSNLFPTVVLNSDGVPMAHITTDEQKFRKALADYESNGIVVWSVLLVEALDRLAKSGGVDADAVAEHLVGEILDSDTAAALGRAFDHYNNGDYEACLMTALPRIERAIREAARQAGLAVYDEPRSDGTRYGAYKGLGKLLRVLKDHVPESHRGYMERALVDQLSLNLRNRALHGLMAQVVPGDAAIALHISLILGLWRSQHDGEAPPEESAP